MKYSFATAILFALSSVVLGTPLLSRQSNSPSLDDISNAVNLWSADTSSVSQLLGAAESLSPTDLVSQAATALAPEKDELTHKAVLDAQFLNIANPNTDVQQANAVLVTQGTFQVVGNYHMMMT